MNRLLKFWVAEAGLDPKKYGKESLRRTRVHRVAGHRRLDECVGLTGPCRVTMAWRRTVWLGDLGVGWIGVRFKVNPPWFAAETLRSIIVRSWRKLTFI
jgi:hypothetical protein